MAFGIASRGIFEAAQAEDKRLHNRAVLGIEREKLALTQQQVRSEERAKRRDLTFKAIDQKTTGILSKAVEPIVKRGTRLPGDVERIEKLAQQSVASVQSLVDAADEAGYPGAQQYAADRAQEQLERVLSLPTPEESGRAAAVRRVSEAEEVAGAIAGDPSDKAAVIAQQLGYTQGSKQEGEFMLLARIAIDPNSPPELVDLVRARMAKLTNTSPLVSQVIGGGARVDEEGNVVRIGGGGATAVGGGAMKSITPTNLDQQRKNLSDFNRGINITREVLARIDQDPAQFGLTGSVIKAGTNLGGIVRDLAEGGMSAFGFAAPGDLEEYADSLDEFFLSNVTEEGSGTGMSQEAADALRPTAQGQLDVFESMLTFLIARANQPTDRLLKDNIDQARELSKLRGLRSTERVKERITEVMRQLEFGRRAVIRRMQQGVSGTSSVPPVGQGGASAGGAPESKGREAKVTPSQLDSVLGGAAKRSGVTTELPGAMF